MAPVAPPSLAPFYICTKLILTYVAQAEMGNRSILITIVNTNILMKKNLQIKFFTNSNNM